MGHYFNKELIDDLVVDVSEAGGTGLRAARDGGLKLVAVEYVVPGAGSNPPGVSEPPTVLGQEMMILVPAVGWYTGTWVWSTNPAGMSAWSPEGQLYVAGLGEPRRGGGGPRLTLTADRSAVAHLVEATRRHPERTGRTASRCR